MRKGMPLVLFFLFLMETILLASPGDRRVLRIGGLELPPFGYGMIETQPHQSMDSSNVDFKNYYARAAVWIFAKTTNGDTILTCPNHDQIESISRFQLMNIYKDTTNVLQLPGVEYTTISVYRDTLAGWRVGQFAVSFDDHALGVLLFLIQNRGRRELRDVHVGMQFDFDVPDNQNIPTYDDDILSATPTGFTIYDSQASRGISIEALTGPLSYNYWRSTDAPVDRRTISERITQSIVGSPATPGDYHFYLGNGSYRLRPGESVVLAYRLSPYRQGFAKPGGYSPEVLREGLSRFIKNQNTITVPADVQTAESGELTPGEFRLHRNFPNPFNSTTQIKFALAKTTRVKLEIFNIAGQRVKFLVNRTMEAGAYTISWRGVDDDGLALSSGVYIYRLLTPEFKAEHKMLLIK